MTNFNYLQKLFFLLVMGFSLSFICACGDDEEDETMQNPNRQTTGIINGHEWVDLGLSVKWATCNVGASSSEEYGGYYAWGETEEKSDYSWKTYKWCKGSNDSMTKYCLNNNYGTVDNKTVLDHEDDVAHIKWGGSWRMPTSYEIQELFNNCSWEWTTLNDVDGQLITGPNGSSIFLPAARGTGIYHIDKGSYGVYWSASLYQSHGDYAYGFYFYDGRHRLEDYDRDLGYTIRPVTE